MPGRGPQTFKKRQKEQERKERREEKMAKRLAKKANKGSEPEEPETGAESDGETEAAEDLDPERTADTLPGA
jgi:hypothetical protein